MGMREMALIIFCIAAAIVWVIRTRGDKDVLFAACLGIAVLITLVIFNELGWLKDV
jgi:hypothetical protein